MTSGQMKSRTLKLTAAFIYYHKPVDAIVSEYMLITNYVFIL